MVTINLISQEAPHRARTGFWVGPRRGEPCHVFVRVLSSNQRRPYFWIDYILPDAGNAAWLARRGNPAVPVDRVRKVHAFQYERR